MMSFLRFLTEAIQKSELQSLRKEAQMFSKNIRRIQSGRDLYIVVQAYAKWNARLEKIMDSLVDQDAIRDNRESYASQKLREKMWNLRVARHEFWFLARYSDSSLYGTPSPHEEHPTYIYNSSNQDTWDAYYRKFDEKRNSVYTKFSKLVREAFDALDDFLSEKEDTISTTRNDEDFKFEGVSVRFMYSDDQEDEHRKKYLPPYLVALRTILKRFRALRLDYTLNRTLFVLDMTSTRGSSWDAGYYEAGRIVSTMWGYQDPRVIAHELGHHVFKKVLSNKQREAWDALIRQSVVSFTEVDFRVIRSAFDAAVNAIKDSGHYKLVGDYVYSGVWENIPRFITDPLVKDLYTVYLKQNPITMGVWKKDVDKSWEEWKDEVKPFAYNVPTGYSNKNTEEAFCEVFSYYIMKMPLKPLIRHQFFAITGFPDA